MILSLATRKLARGSLEGLALLLLLVLVRRTKLISSDRMRHVFPIHLSEFTTEYRFVPLIQEEDAEAERIKAERLAAYNAKKANKPKTVAKVCTLWSFSVDQSMILYLLVCSYSRCQAMGR